MHLREATTDCMSAYMSHVPIGLLIGSNCPQVLELQKVIPLSGDGPFAV